MQRICSSLQNNNFDVLLIGREKSSSIPLTKQIFKQKRIRCWFERSFLFYLEYNLRLFFYLNFAKTDILSPVDLDTILPSYLVSKWSRKMIVFDAHEYFTELPELNGRPYVKKVWNWIANFTLPNIPNAYTVNQSLAELFTEKYKVPYQYIRNISSPKKIEKDIQKNEKIILYQGALNVGRGLETSIRVMQHLEHCRLELAGDGDLTTSLKKLVLDLGLEKKVTFLGQISPEELSQKTAQAYIGLNVLSNDSLNYYYSLANKFFDYMHAGIPSINMDFPEYRLINETIEVSVLLSELNEITLANAIQRLIEDKVIYDRIKENTKSAKQLYTWENEKVKLLKIYNNLS